jgi:hypothetical protein
MCLLQSYIHKQENEPTTDHPYYEANQDVLEHSCMCINSGYLHFEGILNVWLRS